MKIDGIEIKIIKKPIKNIYLKVTEEGVVITASNRASDSRIEAFAKAHINWIKNKLSGIKPKSDVTELSELSVFGEKLPVERKHGANYRAALSGKTVVITAPDNPDTETMIKLLEDLYKKLMKANLPKIASEAERLTKKKASEWKVRVMKTRWGTCNVKTAAITMNAMLVKFPVECIIAVAVHELCHLYEPDHSPRFKKLCESFLPGCEKYEKMLQSPCF